MESTPVPPAPPPVENKSHSHAVFYILLILALMIGVGAGSYILSKNQKTPSSNITKKEATVSLPADAQKIEECVNQEGALYIRQEDIPVGPVYMVHNNQIIGLQYMVPKDKIISNNSMDFLPSHGVKVDHVDIGP